ncbi:MAG: sigma-70 family RNA polymerase sigma factor [Clostridia bacterium]|nr:sigma-70 family RNA polymerase sigma factor [Clostridia bacterium]
MKELIIRAQGGDKLAFEEIIARNEKLVWSIVHRFKGRGVDLQDLFQIGAMGLIKAVHGYDTIYETEFSTYAVPKIMGEIKRFFRDDGMIKVSRDIKTKAAIINKAIAKLEQENHEVRISDIVNETGMDEEEIAYIRSATDYAFSLDAPINDDGLMLKDSVGTDDGEEKLIEKLSLKNALEKLPPKEKKVIILRFFRDMTQQKTADALGMSQVQVSRTEKRAIELMRKTVL